MANHAPTRPPLSESPWFWAYLFCTFALAIVVVFQTKLQSRQTHLDLQGQGRRHAMHHAAAPRPKPRPDSATGPGTTAGPAAGRSEPQPSGDARASARSPAESPAKAIVSARWRRQSLLAVLGGVLLIAWCLFWVQRWRRMPLSTDSPLPLNKESTT